MNTVAPHLLSLLRESIGNPLTVELAAQICAAAAPPPSKQAIDPASHPAGSFSGVTFHVERMADVIEEIQPLHREHWVETEEYRWVVGLDVDYDQYVAAERQGRFVLFTCRDNGRMVGYLMMYLFQSAHMSRRQANEDALFFTKSARVGLRALAFVRFALARLEAMGVEHVIFTSKLARDSGVLYRRLKFRHVADLYALNLGAGHGMR